MRSARHSPPGHERAPADATRAITCLTNPARPADGNRYGRWCTLVNADARLFSLMARHRRRWAASSRPRQPARSGWSAARHRELLARADDGRSLHSPSVPQRCARTRRSPSRVSARTYPTFTFRARHVSARAEETETPSASITGAQRSVRVPEERANWLTFW